MKTLKRFICFILGHRWFFHTTVVTLMRADMQQHCSRCGKTEPVRFPVNVTVGGTDGNSVTIPPMFTGDNAP
jgi:hypothetical protein